LYDRSTAMYLFEQYKISKIILWMQLFILFSDSLS
jgi:hypothetical protein